MPFSPESQQRRTENILASISDCFFALDAQWRFVFLNPQAQEFFGRSSAELLGQTVWQSLPMMCGTTIERELRRVRENGGRSNFVVQLPGDGRWIEHTLYARDGDAEVPEAGGGISVYFRDVTLARQHAEATRSRDDFYRLLVENAREYGIIALDLEGRITHWNEGARRIFGWSEDEVREQKGDLIFTPQDHENGAPEQEMNTALREGRAQDERWHLKKDGSLFWAEGAMMALGFEEGEVRGFVKILRDNTEKLGAQNRARENEDRFKRVSDATGVALWAWEPGRDVIHYQHALDTLYGFPVEDFAKLGANVHPDDLEPLQRDLAGVLESGRTAQILFRLSPEPNKSPWKWILSIVSLDHTEDGAPLFLGVNSDVSERRQQQLALEESQTHLQNVVRAANIALWLWDPQNDRIIEQVNLDEIFECPEVDLRVTLALLHPEDRDRCARVLQSAVQDEAPYDVEIRLRRQTGNSDPDNPADWKWVLITGAPRHEPGGPLFSGFAFDISARKEAELSRRVSEERYTALVNASTTMVWRTSPEGHFLDSNGWSQYTGQTFEESAGFGWFDAMFEEDRERVTREWNEAVEQKSPLVELRYRVRHHSGQVRYTLVRAVPIVDAGGQLIEWLGTLEDVHDQMEAQQAVRESEARYAALVRASATVVWRGPADISRIEMAGWRDYTGAEVEYADNHSWMDFIHPDEHERVRDEWSELLAHPRSMDLRQRLRDRSGQYRHVLVRAVPLFEADGHTVREWIGTLTDVHERVIAEELRELFLEEEQRARQVAEEARAEAERANRMKDDFLAVVSHELRTPLNAILGWSSLLQRGDLPPESALEGLAVIERNARSQAQIVDDILDVARIVTGKLKVEMRSLDLEVVAREALEATQTAATTRGVVLSSQLRSLRVEGDTVRLRQVMWNLLTNAIKFSSSGGHVQLMLSRTGDRARLEVSDEGAGIAPEFLPHVFERFRQADSSSTRRHGGLGLGLALVRSIVEAHGGHVEARSDGLGRGATFCVELPLSPAARETPVEEQFQPGGKLANVSALVCDDAPDTLNFSGLLLRRAGARVVLASSVTQARTLLLQQRFDVLLSDIAMPDEDGYELLLWAKEHLPHLPVIAMTAYAGVAENARAREAGFAAFIAKPMDAEVLVEAITGVLTQTQAASVEVEEAS